MRRIRATLPTLGTISVDFYAESAALFEFLGAGETRRLRSVPHLGVAASVFTGVNHSRLEYTLLQCAVIGLVAKLYKDHELLALSNNVQLAGINQPISSGEELLKCWALLSNFGHTQYTYGVERSLLQQARRDPEFNKWLTDDVRPIDLRNWCRQVVVSYSDDQMHFLLALLRIRLALPPRDRQRGRMIKYIRNLVLPLDRLFPQSPTLQYKLSRLRFVYERVRFLSMVTLDSYYSHHPLRVQLNAAVAGLGEITTVSGSEAGFERVLAATAGWLANELYLHPDAVAAQRAYELRGARELPRRYSKALKRSKGMKGFVNQLMFNGFGRPAVGRLLPLVRMTFMRPRLALLGRRDLFETLCDLERDLAKPPDTYASIDRNRFTGEIHIDLLYASGCVLGNVVNTYLRLRRWLERQLEATALEAARSLLPQLRKHEELIEAQRLRTLSRALRREAPIVRSVFSSFLRYLLPEGKVADAAELMPGTNTSESALLRLKDSRGVVHDLITPELDKRINENPRGLSADRLRELEGLRQLVATTDAPFVVVCPDRFVVRNEFGKNVDEWDGVLLEIRDDRVVLTILETKNLGSRARNEREAFQQLAATKRLLLSRHRFVTRRTRFRGIGAILKCVFLEYHAPTAGVAMTTEQQDVTRPSRRPIQAKIVKPVQKPPKTRNST
jgi:hypothetical protein